MISFSPLKLHVAWDSNKETQSQVFLNELSDFFFGTTNTQIPVVSYF